MRRNYQQVGSAIEQPEEVEFAILRGLVYLRHEANEADLTRLAVAIGNVLASYLETLDDSRFQDEDE